MEKQRDKAAKRVQRKLEKTTLGAQTDEAESEEPYTGLEDGVDDYEPETPDTQEDSSDPR